MKKIFERHYMAMNLPVSMVSIWHGAESLTWQRKCFPIIHFRFVATVVTADFACAAAVLRVETSKSSFEWHS